MNSPVKPPVNANVSTTTIDVDFGNILAATVDPRNQMAERLLFRGHATLDEILGVSFGTWPPKGIDVIGGNTHRVDFVSLSTLFNTNDPNILNEKGGNALGFAAAGKDRHIWISDRLKSGGDAVSMLNSVVGHEAAHILQFDHQSRADSAFGGIIGNRVKQSYSQPVSDLLADSVFGRHTDAARLQAANKQFEGKAYGIDYYKHGLEIQARIHEVMVAGYPKWGQLPQNREQFLVAIQNAGVALSPTTQAELAKSPNYAEAKKIFGGDPIPTRAAGEINLARSTLTDIGQIAFEKDTLTRMYGDLIEMYGDRQGRARFGYGVNEYAMMREARVNTNPNNVMDIPDFKKFVTTDDGVFVIKAGTDADTYAKTRDAFKSGSINFSEVTSGLHGEGMYVGKDEFIKIFLQRQAAREPDIKLPGIDDTSATPQRVLSQTDLLMTNKDIAFLPIGKRPEADRQILINELTREGVAFRQVQPALLGGELALEINKADAGKFKAMKAEAQLERPLMLDPASTKYQAQVAQAQYQRQMHDYSRQYQPVDPAMRARTLLAQAEIINTVGKGDYISIHGKTDIEKGAMMAALDQVGIQYKEKTSSLDGGKQVLAIDQADMAKFRTLHVEAMMAKAPVAAPDPAAAAQLADANRRAQEARMRTLGGSEIINTVNRGDYISLEGRSAHDKQVLMETLAKAGIGYTEKKSSLDGGKQVLAINQADTEKFRTLHTEAVTVAKGGAVLASAVPAEMGNGKSPQTSSAFAAPESSPSLRPGAAAAVAGVAALETRVAGMSAKASPTLGSGVGIGMGVYGLSQKLGENGTAAKDLKDERTSTLAKASIASDVAAIAVDSTELLTRASRGMAAAAKVGRVAAPVGVALSVASGAIDYKIAEKQGDGKRAAAAIGSTTGGVVAAAAGGVVGAKLGALAGAKIGGIVGAFFGGVGAGPGIVVGGAIGGVVGGVAGALGFGAAGAEGGKKVAEATMEKSLQKKFDDDKKAELAAAKPAASPTASPAASPAPRTQAAANDPAYNEPSAKYARKLEAPSTEKFAANAPPMGKEFARVSAETVAAAPKVAVNDPVYKAAAGPKVAVLPVV